MTLIELVAAMAVFALVAVMGLQALDGTLRLRGRLTGEDQRTAEMGLALNLLRHDLSAILPLLFYPPERGAARSALDLAPDGCCISFSAGGQPDLPAAGAGQDLGANLGLNLGFHRIEWRHDPARKRLTRRIWPVLYPALPAAVGPEVEILTGVTGIGLRSHWPQLGWVEGADSGQPRAPAEEAGADSDGVLRATRNSYTDTLPEAVEVTLEIEGFGRIVLVESLK